MAESPGSLLEVLDAFGGDGAAVTQVGVVAVPVGREGVQRLAELASRAGGTYLAVHPRQHLVQHRKVSTGHRPTPATGGSAAPPPKDPPHQTGREHREDHRHADQPVRREQPRKRAQETI